MITAVAEPVFVQVVVEQVLARELVMEPGHQLEKVPGQYNRNPVEAPKAPDHQKGLAEAAEIHPVVPEVPANPEVLHAGVELMAQLPKQ